MKKQKKKFSVLFVVSLCIICVASVVCAIVIPVVMSNKAKYYSSAMDLPMFYITTENNAEITSKEEYINCKITVSNTEEEYELDEVDAEIRGRGNSTWNYAKKPYRIKFAEKTNLFGNGKAKSWTLIANYQDNSMMRNYLAYSIGSSFDDLESTTTTTQFVDVFLNDKYLGVYLVCEQMQTGSNRVDIEESMDIGVDTGYLLELDDRASEEGEEGVDYFVCEGKEFAIKTPDTEEDDFSTDYVNFIKGYMEDTFEALKSGDFDAVNELIDIKSFADSYIVNELFKNNDMDFSSFYLYKDAGGKLCAGPIWDYDSCAGNAPEAKKEANKTNNIYGKINPFYNYLLNYDEFVAEVKTELTNHYQDIKDIIDGKCDMVLDDYVNSFTRNFKCWGYSKERLTHLKTWQDNVKYLKNWLYDSLDYMYEYYC